MKGIGMRAYPLLALLALSSSLAPIRSAPHGDPHVSPTAQEPSPPKTQGRGDRSPRSTPPRNAAIDRERSVTLLLLLGGAAEHWRSP